jgi:hypothetical protein
MPTEVLHWSKEQFYLDNTIWFLMPIFVPKVFLLLINNTLSHKLPS